MATTFSIHTNKTTKQHSMPLVIPRFINWPIQKYRVQGVNLVCWLVLLTMLKPDITYNMREANIHQVVKLMIPSTHTLPLALPYPSVGNPHLGTLKYMHELSLIKTLLHCFMLGFLFHAFKIHFCKQ